MIVGDEKKIKTKAVFMRPNKFILTWKYQVFKLCLHQGWVFFSPLERRIRKFLCEAFFTLSNIRFCASCPDAACRGESLITEAGGANARPSARVSRRVRKLHCERDAGLQRGRRERRRVRYHPESDDYFFLLHVCSNNSKRLLTARCRGLAGSGPPGSPLLLLSLLMRRRLAAMTMGPTAAFQM